ncbi:hypothetical protein CR194_03915 [Salipaludibacillus keqinensis]|uniref:Multidrug ABC transporter permease n=1 Tax=Salipaludibacillus keqinensis TaxID=2045207 RepID=A0A323TLQ5_9BACI|nr:DUF6449 domain-containing protein [Salipaludibacillus keqinensis]PYZ94687.1 hypothetical protein CR194_03915 [Salipaludibacillus keqinensis]
MKSTTSLWNKALFKLQLRTVTWLGILLTLLLMVMLPVSILVREIRFGANPDHLFYLGESSLNVLSEFSFPFQLLVFAIFPVLLGIVLLNFSTKKEATYFMHSLPFKRETILANTYGAGVVALITPLLLTGVTLGILRFFLEQPFYSFVDVLAWIGISTLIVLFLYVVTMAIGVFVGNGLLHGGLTYTVIIVPALLIILTLVNLQYFITGLALTSYTETLATKGIFFIRLIELYSEPFTVVEYVIYTLVSAGLVILSFVAYVNRPSEASDQAIVYPIVRSIFLYGLTFFAMLLGGLYFTEGLQGGLAWTMFGYVFGAFIAYTILQMILQKAIRLSWPWKGFAGFTAVIAVLLIPVNIGGTLYANNIPNHEEIASVAIYQSYSYGYDEVGEAPRLTGDKSIEQVINVHREMKDESGSDIYQWNTVTIDYELKEGGSLRREYSVDDKVLAEATEDLRSNEEFKRAYDPVFQLNELDITYASIYSQFQGEENRISGQDDLDTIISLLEEDLAKAPSSVLAEQSQSSIGELYFHTPSNRSDQYIMLRRDYENTLAWLTENNYAGALLTSENIESMTIVKSTGEDFYMQLDEMMYSSQPVEEVFEDNFETSDAREIEQLLDIGQDYYHGDYVILLNGGGDIYYFLGFDQEDAPDFVLDRLE